MVCKIAPFYWLSDDSHINSFTGYIFRHCLHGHLAALRKLTQVHQDSVSSNFQYEVHAHHYIFTFLPFSLLDLIFPLFTVIAIFRYSRTGILCNNLSEGLKMLAIRQLLSQSMLHGLVAGKLMLGTGLHLEYIQCSLSRSSVSEQ
jgi:hypothetical protein